MGDIHLSHVVAATFGRVFRKHWVSFFRELSGRIEGLLLPSFFLMKRILLSMIQKLKQASLTFTLKPGDLSYFLNKKFLYC